MLFRSAAALGEDFGEEWEPGEDALRFGEKGGGAGRGADNVSPGVEGGAVFGEPAGDEGFVGGGEEVGEVGGGHGGRCDRYGRCNS